MEQFFCDDGAHDTVSLQSVVGNFSCVVKKKISTYIFCFQVGPEKVEAFFILLARCTKQKEKWCRSPFALAKGTTVFPANFTKYL